MNEVINKAVKYLNTNGFYAYAGDGYFDVVLSDKDSDIVINANRNSGIAGADGMVRKAGNKIAQLLLANLGVPVYWAIDGYEVDDDKQTIAVRIVPKRAQWKNLPKGWTKESLRKMWDSLTGDREHKISACIKKLRNAPGIDNPEAVCASLAREVGYKPGARSIVTRNSRLAGEFLKVQSLFRKFLTEETDVSDAVKVCSEILGSKLSGRRRLLVSSLINNLRKCVKLSGYNKIAVESIFRETMRYLRERLPVNVAIATMKKYLNKVNTIEERKHIESGKTACLKSLRNKILAFNKLKDRPRTYQKGYDPVTDVYTGKDEGPEPTFAQEKVERSKEEEVIIAQEKAKKPKEEEVTIAQEKNIKANRHFEAIDVLEKAIELGMVKEEARRQEYLKLVAMNDMDFENIKKVVFSTVDPTGLILVDGQLANIEKLFS